MRAIAASIAATAILSILSASPAIAQDRPAPIVEIEAGWVGFADDGIVSEMLVGAAARWYLVSRVSVGPEVVYLASEHHSHLIVTGNLMFDIVREGSGRSVIPFLVIGGGLFQTRDTFFTEPFTSNEGAFTAGGGVRVIVNDRVTAGVDARMGWEPHVRINGSIGIRIGK
jgi:hypothetical protein